MEWNIKHLCSLMVISWYFQILVLCCACCSNYQIGKMLKCQCLNEILWIDACKILVLKQQFQKHCRILHTAFICESLCALILAMRLRWTSLFTTSQAMVKIIHAFTCIDNNHHRRAVCHFAAVLLCSCVFILN